MIKQPEWQIGVFPYQSVNGVVVEWNSVVRRRDPGEQRWQVVVLKSKESQDLARANAERWIRDRFKSR